MKKVFNSALLLLLLSGSVYAQDQPALTGNAIVKPQLTFVNNDTAYDFGGIPRGESLPYVFEIKNTGDAPLLISGMTCESRNVQCKWPAKAVKPGKKGYITVTYSARDDEGSFKTNVFIASNATDTAYAFLHIIGAIIPASSPYQPSSSGSKKGGGRRGGR